MGKELAGEVTQEILLPEEITKDELYDFINQENSNGKIIYEILERLIFTNDITITTNASGHFKLKYPY